MQLKKPGLILLEWRRALNCVAAVIIAISGLTGCGPRKDESSSSDKKLAHTAGGIDMVSIPPGEFMMGSANGAIDAKPPHPVKVNGFLMDEHEVTQEVYEKVIGTNPSRRKNPQNPVEQVTWIAAAKFCNARSLQEGLKPCYDTNTWACDFSANGYRLPTEAEWEYAYRAGTSTEFYFSGSTQDLKSFAWFEGNSQTKPHPVGQRRPNAWGLYDMAGNVWEWCNDFYGVKYYRESPTDNPRGPQEGEKRVLRGGAWSTSAESCTAFVRNCDEAGLTDVCLTMDSNGFRCVRRE